MPPMDPVALKKAQAEAARARITLDKTRADAAAVRAELAAERAGLDRAAASGDDNAIRRAKDAVERAGNRLAELSDIQRDLGRALGDRLGAFRDFDMDAPADLPLLLMPLRLETRFAKLGGKDVLRIRIHPDEIHLDRSAPGLSPEEETAGRAYWTTLFAAPDDSGITAAWAVLKSAVGRARARHVALSLRPTNPESRGGGATPAFPAVTALDKGAASPRLLPERFHVTAWQGGAQLRAAGAAVDPGLKIGLLGEDAASLVDQDGLRVPEGSEWLHDYALALKMGMAIDLALPRRGPIERLYVYGVSQSRTPAQAAAGLEALLAAHDGAGRLAFVPSGVPTNNTEAGASDWDRWREPEPVPLHPPALSSLANGPITAAALGTANALLSGLPNAALREHEAAAAMNTALWPATWGYFLETLDEAQDALSPRLIEDIRRFHQSNLRAGGALPTLRVGPQLYGVLPFAGFGHASPPGKDRTEAQVDSLTRKLLPNWLAGLADVPRLTGSSDAATILRIFGHAPQSWGVRARKCLSTDFLKKIEAATKQAKPAAEVEALLSQLIAESLGYSYAYKAGTLDETSLPVALPYADPARDGAFLTKLLDGGNPGALSSIFQALVSLGWAQVKATATPGPRFAQAVEVTQTFDAALTQRIVALAQSDRLAPVEEYQTILATVPDDGKPRLRTLALPALQEDAAERVIAASSIAERNRLGELLVETTMLGRSRLSDLRQALTTLRDLSLQPEGADFTRLVAETLDSASHRLDAWIMALSWARFQRTRAATPQGLSVGAFGWLFDLSPQERVARDGGFIAAPTLEQATTAGILRSAYLAHNRDGAGGGAFAIDLSSARIRRAQGLLDGVANGQTIGALLGYAFERRIKDAGCERFILTFRGLAPLVGGRLTEGGSPVTDPDSQAVAGANVTDMTRLLARWKAPAEGPGFIFAKLAERPEGNEYLDPNVAWPAPSAAQKAAITAAMEDAVADADAVADLLLAESVHQMAQGNIARASATLDAAGRGEAPPPATADVVTSHGPGTLVSHRLIAVAAPGRGWPGAGASPRALVSPVTESWAAARLPDPARVPLGVAAAGGTATVADTGLSALDFAAAARHPALLHRILRARAGLANPDAAFPPANAGQVPLDEAILTAATLQEVLDRARPLDALSLGLPGSAGWKPVPDALPQAAQRLEDAAALLKGRLQGLTALLSAPQVMRDDLMAALLSLSDFGITLPEMSESRTADIALLALQEGENRLARYTAARTMAVTQDSLTRCTDALFGDGLPLPLTHRFAPDDPAEALGERAFSPPAGGAIQRFLADMGTVRPLLGRFQRLALLTAINGTPPALMLRQLCGIGEDPPDHWIGAGLPPEKISPTCPVVGIVADAPDGLDLGADVAGLILDDWTETLPQRREAGEGQPAQSRTTAGVALHADAPASQPPQVLILGLSPDGKRWTEDSLCGFLDDVMDLAKARLVSLETLPLAARVLPAIYTQSWSLQGTPVLDWSRLLIDAKLLARSEGLKNFTMIREV
jgi:hypothetical protein